MNVLHCGLNADEFNRISMCNNAKEIWDTLEVTHKCTNQVKESKVNIIVHKYYLFNLNDTETIFEIFMRFIDNVNRSKLVGTSQPRVGEQDPTLTPKELGTKGRHIESKGCNDAQPRTTHQIANYA